MDRALAVLHRLEHQAEKNFVPSIGPHKAKIVARVLRQYKPKTILEVGTLFGYSAIVMARLLPKDGTLLTIEIDPKTATIAQQNITEAGLSEKIDIRVGNALHIIPALPGIFDLLFLDAAKDQYFPYLKLAERNLHKSSVVIADNVGIFADAMRDYLPYVRTSGTYTSETTRVPLAFHDHIEDAMEISIKNA